MVFDKNWFLKHQKKLLWLANSKLGNLVFGFNKIGQYLEKEKPIVKITPCSMAQLLAIEGDEITLKEQFSTNEIYAIRIKKVFYPFWLLLHFWDWLLLDRFIPQLSFGFSTLTANPQTGGGGGNTTCDGEVDRAFVGGGW